MVHELEHIPHLDIHVELLPIESKIRGHFSQAHRAESEWLQVCLVQLGRAIHQTFVSLTVPDRQDVGDLVTRGLHCSILHLSGDLGGEDTLGLLL